MGAGGAGHRHYETFGRRGPCGVEKYGVRRGLCVIEVGVWGQMRFGAEECGGGCGAEMGSKGDWEQERLKVREY